MIDAVVNGVTEGKKRSPLVIMTTYYSLSRLCFPSAMSFGMNGNASSSDKITQPWKISSGLIQKQRMGSLFGEERLIAIGWQLAMRKILMDEPGLEKLFTHYIFV